MDSHQYALVERHRPPQAPPSPSTGHASKQSLPPSDTEQTTWHQRTGTSQVVQNPKALMFKMATLYFIGLSLIIAHFMFFYLLDGKAVEQTKISQGSQSAIANLLTLVAEVCLLSGIGVSYDQLLARLCTKTSLRNDTIEKLKTLVASPWNLFRPTLLHGALGQWTIALTCLLISITAVFPPGALEVEFEDGVVPRTFSNVPSFNVSDWGNGTLQDFVNYAMFEMNADLSFMNAIRPDLSAIARSVLTSGEHIPVPSPCNGPCRYSIDLNGPRFHCHAVKLNNSMTEGCGLAYSLLDDANFDIDYKIKNNSFRVIWRPTPDTCESDEYRTLRCSISLATYQLDIENFSNGTQSIEARVKTDSNIWTDDSPLQAQFYYYYMNGQQGLDAPFDAPINQSQLTTSFGNTQAYAISRAALEAMGGEVNYATDGPIPIIWGNGTAVVGSPYMGLEDRWNARFNITPHNLERYLRDVVISTISLNPSGQPQWTNVNDVEALEGAPTYKFKGLIPFIIQYALCLGATTIIYFWGIRALYKNTSG